MIKKATVQKTLKLKNSNSICNVRERISESLARFEYSENDIFAVKLALEEAFVNAVEHGNKGMPDKEVTISYRISSEKINIKIADQGPGFDPEAVPDPRLKENIYKADGRGVLLIKAYMDKVTFNEKGNQISMTKYKS